MVEKLRSRYAVAVYTLGAIAVLILTIGAPYANAG